MTPFSDVRCVPPCSINYNATLISSKGPTHATASKDNFTLQTLSGTFRSGFPTASIAASRGCGLNRTVVSMATAINNGTLHHWFPVQSGQYCEPNRTTVSGGTVASSGNVSIHWSPVQSGRIRARTITATSYNVVKLTLESVVSSVTVRQSFPHLSKLFKTNTLRPILLHHLQSTGPPKLLRRPRHLLLSLNVAS